jgi:ADP-ribose pyrophosphatase
VRAERSVFLAGALADAELRAIVLGRDVSGVDGTLPDYQIQMDHRTGQTPLSGRVGALAEGIVVVGLSDADLARLTFYEAVVGAKAVLVPYGAAGFVTVFTGEADAGLSAFDAGEWAAVWGAVARAAAGDVMALFPGGDTGRIAARYVMMLVRAASRVRAAQAAPTGLRHKAGAGDVQVVAQATPYAAFFAVEEYDVGWRRFRGDMSAPARRAVFVVGDAVTVLPYDPVRDRVLLIEQFRVGPMARGDGQPWLLEAIAGRVDAGETPEDAARREAVEEAGLRLGGLLKVAEYYPTPGANTEYLYSYVALCDLPDDVTGIFGLASEAEDIRSHLVQFDRLMDLVASGEGANAPLILTALWLQRERAGLRGQSLAGS